MCGGNLILILTKWLCTWYGETCLPCCYGLTCFPCCYGVTCFPCADTNSGAVTTLPQPAVNSESAVVGTSLPAAASGEQVCASMILKASIGGKQRSVVRDRRREKRREGRNWLYLTSAEPNDFLSLIGIFLKS